MTVTWIKLDDTLPDHPKIRKLRKPDSRWAYVASICYAGRNRTDGLVPFSALGMIDGTRRIAAELVAAGLWELDADGWRIHDFLKHNRSRADADALTPLRAEAGRLGRAAQLAQQLAGQLAGQNPGNLLGKTRAKPGQVDLSLSSSSSDPVGISFPEGEPAGSDFPDVPDPESEREREIGQKPGKLPSAGKRLQAPIRTYPTEEWVSEQREKHGPFLRDFDETLRFHMNGSYYRGCADKCAYLEGKLKAAVEREAAQVVIPAPAFPAHLNPLLEGARILGKKP